MIEIKIFCSTSKVKCNINVILTLNVKQEHDDNPTKQEVIVAVAIRTFGMRIWLGKASNVPETIVEEVPTKNLQPTMHFVAILVADSCSSWLACLGWSRSHQISFCYPAHYFFVPFTYVHELNWNLLRCSKNVCGKKRNSETYSSNYRLLWVHF